MSENRNIQGFDIEEQMNADLLHDLLTDIMNGKRRIVSVDKDYNSSYRTNTVCITTEAMT